MSLVDMKSAETSDETYAQPSMEGAEMPEYPYGLCICLRHEQLTKLGIKDLPAPGQEYHINAVGVVTRASKEAGGDAETAIDIQITMLELIPEKPHAGEEKETPADESKERIVNKGGVKTVLGG